MNHKRFKELLPHFGFQMTDCVDVRTFVAALNPADCFAILKDGALFWYLPRDLEEKKVAGLLDFYQNNPLSFSPVLGDMDRYTAYRADVAVGSYEDIVILAEFLLSGFIQAFYIDDQGCVFPEVLARMNHLLARAADSLPVDSDALFKALEKQPKNALLLNYAGKVFLENGDADRASKCLVDACVAAPFYAEPYSNMGTMMWKEGHKQKAFELFCEALLRNPFNVNLQDNFIQAGLDLGNAEAMDRHLDKVKQYYPEFMGLTYLKALLVLRCGEKQEGIALLRQLLQSDPNDERARSLLGEMMG